jgi:hypothetical protein
VLRQGPGEQIVGRYQDQHWEFATQFLSSFEVTDPTTVRFEDANGQRSAAFGPFHRLHFPNGSCYADEQPFAEFLSRNECWRHAGERRAWPVILICPARV